jgi:hypothetical protein
MKKIKLSQKPKLKFEIVRVLTADSLKLVHGGLADNDPSSEITGTPTVK